MSAGAVWEPKTLPTPAETLRDLFDTQRRTLDLVESQAARIELLEHALHETRQRADTLADALWETTETLAGAVFTKPEEPIGSTAELRTQRDEIRKDFYTRAGLQEAFALRESFTLEPHHFEGLTPQWGSSAGPLRADAHATYDDAQLAGARERFERRDEIRAGELR